MTFVVGNARELTNSRNRIVKQAREWHHECGQIDYSKPEERHLNMKWLTTYSCPDCGKRRPS